MIVQSFNFNQFLARGGRPFDETPLGAALKSLPELTPTSGVWLAGGALRRTIFNQPLEGGDLDFFFNGETTLANFAARLEAAGYKKVKEGEFNEQWELPESKSLPIQLIRVKFYNSAQEIIDSFDYTLCQFVFDGTTLYCGELSLFDGARKHIVIDKITYPVATMRRLLKYHSQGYYACSGTLAEILRQVAASPDLQAAINAEPAYID